MLYRVGLSLRGDGSGSPLEGLPYGVFLKFHFIIDFPYETHPRTHTLTDPPVPFTGRITGKKQGSFRNGKKHGPWVIYWDNGQLYAKGTMKDGKDHGSFERYCKNGQFDSKGPYKDGNQHSPWVSYNRDGSVDAKGTGTFKDGMKVK